MCIYSCEVYLLCRVGASTWVSKVIVVFQVGRPKDGRCRGRRKTCQFVAMPLRDTSPSDLLSVPVPRDTRPRSRSFPLCPFSTSLLDGPFDVTTTYASCRRCTLLGLRPLPAGLERAQPLLLTEIPPLPKIQKAPVVSAQQRRVAFFFQTWRIRPSQQTGTGWEEEGSIYGPANRCRAGLAAIRPAPPFCFRLPKVSTGVLAMLAATSGLLVLLFVVRQLTFKDGIVVPLVVPCCTGEKKKGITPGSIPGPAMAIAPSGCVH